MATPAGTFMQMDSRTGARVQIVMNRPKRGYSQFSAAIPGFGGVTATKPVRMAARKHGSYLVSYRGAGTVTPLSRTNVEFSAGGSPTGPPRKVVLRLRGTFVPKTRVLHLGIWAGRRHYVINAMGTQRTAARAVQAVAKAMAGRPSALYALADDDLRLGTSGANFAHQWNAAFGRGGGIKKVTVIGTIKYVTTTEGIQLAKVPVRVTAVVHGRRQTMTKALLMILDRGSWRWFTIQ